MQTPVRKVSGSKRIALVAHDDRATADFIFTSPLTLADYEIVPPDYSAYNNRLQPPAAQA